MALVSSSTEVASTIRIPEHGFATIVNADPVTGVPACLGEVAADAASLTAFGRPWRHLGVVPLDDLRGARPALYRALLDAAPQREVPTRSLLRFDASGVSLKREEPLALEPAAALRFFHARFQAGTIGAERFLRAIPPEAVTRRRVRLAARSRDSLQSLASVAVLSGESVTGILAADEMTPTGPRIVLVDRIEAEHTALLHEPSCAGVLALRGSAADHFALIAREHGFAYAVIEGAVRTDRGLHCGELAATYGAPVTVDAERGRLLLGAGEIEEEPPDRAVRDARRLLAAITGPVVIRLNADTPEDLHDGTLDGAAGVGLVRTEHMLRRGGGDHLLRAFLDADNPAARRAALEAYQDFFRTRLARCLRQVRELPLTVRLLDYPLHELGGRQAGEVNPMLGLRGVRQGIQWPPLYLAQLVALLVAAVMVRREGVPLRVIEILIPLVVGADEVRAVRAMLDAVSARHPESRDLTIRLGAMIETPAAALATAELARVCDFLSFGTNDLTQLALGLSREDYGPVLRAYRRAGLLERDPFVTLHPAVAQVVRDAAAAARRARPEVTIGLCGDQAADLVALRLCADGLLDYVSVPRHRLAPARLRALQLDTAAAEDARP